MTPAEIDRAPNGSTVYLGIHRQPVTVLHGPTSLQLAALDALARDEGLRLFVAFYANPTDRQDPTGAAWRSSYAPAGNDRGKPRARECIATSTGRAFDASNCFGWFVE